MPWRLWRRAIIVGLAFVFVLGLVPTALTKGLAIRTDAHLKRAQRYLRGVTIVVDPGHGGDDPGAVVEGVREKEVTLQIATALQRTLEEQGAKVVLTRAEDIDLGGPIREELSKRVALIEQHKAALYVSIHANKDGCYCWGAQTFYQRKGMPAGKQLAETIQNRLRQMTDTTRQALPANYYVLRTSPVPAAMVEVGFLTNAKERQMLQDPAYHKQLAKAVTLGLADFLKLQVPDANAGVELGR